MRVRQQLGQSVPRMHLITYGWMNGLMNGWIDVKLGRGQTRQTNCSFIWSVGCPPPLPRGAASGGDLSVVVEGSLCLPSALLRVGRGTRCLPAHCSINWVQFLRSYIFGVLHPRSVRSPVLLFFLAETELMLKTGTFPPHALKQFHPM